MDPDDSKRFGSISRDTGQDAGAARSPHNLVPHPSSPVDREAALAAEAQFVAPDRLALRFRLAGDTCGVRLPEPGAIRRAERLWEHTCFEAFLATPGERSYLEFNFAPSGEWAAYRFDTYREGVAPISRIEPQIAVLRSATSLDLYASLRLDPAPAPGARLLLGLSAVIEDLAGGQSYWALRHPPGKPDFHHPDCFALRLAVPAMAGAAALRERGT